MFTVLLTYAFFDYVIMNSAFSVPVNGSFIDAFLSKSIIG